MADRRQSWSACATALRTSFPCRAIQSLLAAVIAILAVLASAENGSAETTARNFRRSPQNEALRSIPWKELDQQDRRRVRQVVDNVTIYHRLPTRVIDCDPDLFTFFQQHPEVIVDTWRLMGISRVTLTPTAVGSYHADDGTGTTGRVQVVHANWGPEAQNLLVVYADGAYEGAPFPGPVRAQSLLIMRSESEAEANGRRYVTVRLDSFVAIQRLDVELLAKTVRPWVNKMADQNFVETLTFVSQYSRAAEKNPLGIERLAQRLTDLDPSTRSRFVALCRLTADRYATVEAASLNLAQHEAP